MASQNGNAAAAEARGAPELDLLARGVNRENNLISGSGQAAPVTITIRGPAVAKGRPRFTRKGFAYSPAKTRKYEAHGRLAAQLAMDDRPPLACYISCALMYGFKSVHPRRLRTKRLRMRHCKTAAEQTPSHRHQKRTSGHGWVTAARYD